MLFAKNEAKMISLTLISNLVTIKAIANQGPLQICEEPIKFLSAIRLGLQ